jgi:hypothetical protein
MIPPALSLATPQSSSTASAVKKGRVWDRQTYFEYHPTQTKGYKKTKESRDGTHETHSRIQFVRQKKKLYFIT